MRPHPSKPRYRRLLIVAGVVFLLAAAGLMGLLAVAREELRFVQCQQLTQGGKDIDEWHASFQRFAQAPIQLGKLRFGFRRSGGGSWVIEELRHGEWVDRPLANAEFRYYSDPTIRLPNDLTNEWRLKVSSQRELLLGFGTNTWNLSSATTALRSGTLPPLEVLKMQPPGARK